MFNPFGPNWRFFLGVALAGLLVWLWSSYQDRGETIDELKITVASQHDTIFFQRNRMAQLGRDSARLSNRLSDEHQKNSDLTNQIKEGENAALRVDQSIESGKQQVNTLVDKLSKQEKYIQAVNGLLTEKLSTANLDSNDTDNTGRIAKLTQYGTVYRDSTQALKRVVGQQSEKIRQQGAVIDRQEGEISELEVTLNGAAYSVQEAFRQSQQEKHFLGFGQKKSKEELRKKVIKHLQKP